MIWLLKPINRRPTEFAPAVDESTGILPGLPPVAGKPVHVAFDGGRMTSIMTPRIWFVGAPVMVSPGGASFPWATSSSVVMSAPAT